MYCRITDVEFVFEAISDLVRKTCCPLRYLQSPSYLKNWMCGDAEVFCETEKRICFPVGVKASVTLPFEMFGPFLHHFITMGFRNIFKDVFLQYDVLFKLAHCSVLLDAPWFRATEKTATFVLIYRFFGWPYCVI